MKFISLASSSHGNAYIVDDGETQALLECGVSHRKLQQMCRAAGYRLTDMAVCLVSHEHKDHANCYEKLLASGIPVWCSDGTANALENDLLDVFDVSPGANVGMMERFGTLNVVPFRTLHDAARPLGFLIQSRVDGEKLVFATDTVNIRYQFPGVNILAVEANYAEDILSLCTHIPEKVIHRIRNSHMEIGTLCGWISTLVLSQCRQIYLLHLSDSTSHEGRFAATKVPAPQHGANITPTVPSWYSKDDDPARVRVQATGGLAIQGGTANREYNFSITYPIA